MVFEKSIPGKIAGESYYTVKHISTFNDYIRFNDEYILCVQLNTIETVWEQLKHCSRKSYQRSGH